MLKLGINYLFTTYFGYKVYRRFSSFWYFTRVLVVCWKVYFGYFGIQLAPWQILTTKKL